MYPKNLASSIIAVLWLVAASNSLQAQAIYKWTDANGQVHYGQKKPDNVDSAQSIDITPTPTTNLNSSTSESSSAAEIARINALSEQLARERRAAEQERQQQTIRDLEQTNQQLQNTLLKQQLEQQQHQAAEEDKIILYPTPYPYPSYPYRPYPPKPYPLPPCQPWPECHKPSPLPQPTEPPRPPLAKPNPPFNPKPIGLDSSTSTQGVFRGR